RLLSLPLHHCCHVTVQAPISSRNHLVKIPPPAHCPSVARIVPAAIVNREATDEKAAWLASFPERNPNPIVEVDFAAGVIHYVNPAAHRLLPDLADSGVEHP